MHKQRKFYEKGNLEGMVTMKKKSVDVEDLSLNQINKQGVERVVNYFKTPSIPMTENNTKKPLERYINQRRREGKSL